MTQTFDICSAVVGHLPYDARVWKEMTSLAEAGYRIKLIGNRYDAEQPVRYVQDGIEVVEFPFGARSGARDNRSRVQSVLAMWREIAATPARAYHAHNVHTGPPMLAAARGRRAKLVYDAHELYGEPASSSVADRAQARALRLVERRMIRSADLTITTNDSRRQVLEDRHGRTGIQVVPNVPYRVDALEPFDPGFPEGRPFVLYQGGIYAEGRAFRETIAALALVPELDLVVLGFGRDSDIEAIRRWATEFGVSERVHLLGPQPFDRLVHTATHAWAGLVPLKPISQNSWLGDTNKLFEYLMAGIPVLASAFPEVKIVADQGSPAVGETFDPEDPESIAGAMRRLLADPRYDERRREARRLGLERFNWETQATTLTASYERMLRG